MSVIRFINIKPRTSMAKTFAEVVSETSEFLGNDIGLHFVTFRAALREYLKITLSIYK